MISIKKMGDAARNFWRGLRAASRDKVNYTMQIIFFQ